MKLMFRATETDAIIAWITADFQLYVKYIRLSFLCSI
jgi:hypothetical protein